MRKIVKDITTGIVLALLLPTNPALAGVPVRQQVYDASGHAVVKIVGEIGTRALLVATEIEKATLTGDKELVIFINSPGGYVGVQEIIISAMNMAKARGMHITCVVSTVAASAAFNILSQCDKRYGLKGSKYLFHPVRAQIDRPMSSPEAAEYADILAKTDIAVIDMLCRSVLEADMTSVQCMDLVGAYYREKLWTLEDLQTFAIDGWITSVNDIKGIPGLFDFKGEL